VKIFLLNVSYAFTMIWSTIKGFIEEHTRRKITLSNSLICKELIDLFPPSQLQKRYGGTAPDVVEGLYWPPRMPEFLVDDEINSRLVPEEQYEKFLEEHPVFTRRPDLSSPQ